MLTLRLAVVVAAALVVGTGCGSDPDPGADGAGGEPAHGGLSLGVSWGEALVAGEPVTWALTVTNEGAPVTLEFRSGQLGDVVLTADDGRQAYRWSDDRSFTAALVEQPLDAGASETFELAEEELDVEPGSYRLTATVPSDPPVPPVEQTVTVG